LRDGSQKVVNFDGSPEQLDGVAAISTLVGRLPKTVRPKVLVGGYAVKAGFVTFIPGADLVADISC
jgi:hypothetical protein